MADPTEQGWSGSDEHQGDHRAVHGLSVPVLGIVFRVMARREITRTGEGGRACATWGMALGIAFCALVALYVVFYLLFLVAVVAGLGDTFSTGAGQGGT